MEPQYRIPEPDATFKDWTNLIRELYMTVSTENYDSRDACINVMYAIQDFCNEHSIPWEEPTQYELDNWPPEDEYIEYT